MENNELEKKEMISEEAGKEENAKKKRKISPAFIIILLVLIGAGVFVYFKFFGSSHTGIDNAPEKAVKGESKELVVYFSWSGNSQKMARWIAEETGADIFRIVPEDAYSKEYSEVADRAKKERDEGTRPALSEHIPADIMAKYDVIYLGYPVWWYDLPMPVWSFLEEYDLSGKTIVPYFSHEGSSNGAGSLGRISELAPNSTVKTGDALSIRGGKVSSSENEVKAWVRGLKLE